MATGDVKPLVVIIGPTSSGKTSLAVNLAEKYGGEIICADSRTVYRGMNVGTAKPSRLDQQRVRHWGIDLVEPGEVFTAADFKRYTEQKIAEIRLRGQVPFLVGGTGLYVDSILFDFQFGPKAEKDKREKLESMSTKTLQLYCLNNNIELPENQSNRRHLVRAIERASISTKRRAKPINNTVVVGITTDKQTMNKRIAIRAEQLFLNNVVEEATVLGKKYGWTSEAMTGNVYRLARQLMLGQIAETEFIDKTIVADRQLVKRQMTWMRRNPYVIWGTLESCEHYLSARLSQL